MGTDDDPGSSSSSPPETLDSFREKWQKELNTTKHSNMNGSKETDVRIKPDNSIDRVIPLIKLNSKIAK